MIIVQLQMIIKVLYTKTSFFKPLNVAFHGKDFKVLT